MTSPSHHRDLSVTERQRVQTLVHLLESFVRSVTDGLAGSTVVFEAPEIPPSSLGMTLQELLHIVKSDASLCSGVVKTTRTVGTLRRLLDLNVRLQQAVTGSDLQAPPESATLHNIADSVLSAMPIVVKVLCVVVENSHSRRSFGDILPSHASGLLELLRHSETLSDTAAVLRHVLLYTHEAKEILDTLVHSWDYLGALSSLCRDAVIRGSSIGTCSVTREMSLLIDTLSLLTATASVTPRPDSTVLECVQKLVADVVLPLVTEREPHWVQQSASEEVQGCLYRVNCELLQLVSVVTLEGHFVPHVDDTIRRWFAWSLPYAMPPQRLLLYWGACERIAQERFEPLRSADDGAGACAPSSSWDNAAQCSSGSSISGSEFQQVAITLREQLSAIRRMNLDTKLVQQYLMSMHSLIVSNRGRLAETCAYIIGRLPGGVKTLCGTLSTVDEEVSSLSCAVLAALLGATPDVLDGDDSQWLLLPLDEVADATTTASGSDASFLKHPLATFVQPVSSEGQRRSPVLQFVAIDGVLLIADMLDDYSDDVLAGAFSILGAMASHARAVHEMMTCGLLKKLRAHLTNISDRIRSGGTSAAAAAGSVRQRPSSSGRRTLVPLAALCCEMVAKLPNAALSVVAFGYTEHIVRDWVVAITSSVTSPQSSDEHAAPIMVPFLRMCHNLAHVDPLAVWNGLQTSENNEAVLSHAAFPWLSVWAAATAKRGGADSGVPLLAAWMGVLQSIDSDAVPEAAWVHAMDGTSRCLTDSMQGMHAKQHRVLLHHFWSLVLYVEEERCSGTTPLRQIFAATLLSSLHTAVYGAPLHRGVGFVLSSIARVMHRWQLATDDALNAIAAVATSETASWDDRMCALTILQESTQAMQEQNDTASLFRAQFPVLLTKIILQCEDTADESDDADNCRAVANTCFHAMLSDAAQSARVLLQVGHIIVDGIANTLRTTAVEEGGNAVFTEPLILGWLGSAVDTDEAHDALVAVVPLLNGITNQRPEVRYVVHDSALLFFFKLTSIGSFLEVPLRVLGIYGLCHCLELSAAEESRTAAVREAELRGAHCLQEWGVFDVLRRVLIEAHSAEALQSDEARSEIRQACFLLAEKVLLLSRDKQFSQVSLASGLLDAAGFVVSTILTASLGIEGVVPHEGCSLLLCLLQDDAQRRALAHSDDALRLAYINALTQLRCALHAEAGGADGHLMDRSSRGYYLLLQVEKYLAE